ncbi:MAG: hypothetical protein ACP5SH_27560, partial [Syntrophobacteraceae bacterium]
FGIAIAGAIMYSLAPFTTRGHIGPFTPPELHAFLHGMHWAYVAGAALALFAASAALYVTPEKPLELQSAPAD